MAELPLDWTPPPRSILYVQPVPAEEGGGVLVGCDCGTANHVIIEDTDQLTAPREMSFTCTCLSVHWFTVGPIEAVAGA